VSIEVNGRLYSTTVLLYLLFVLATLSLVFCAGAYLGQVTFEPQVIITREIHTVEKVVPKPVDRVIERVIYEPVERVVERVVYEPVERVIIKRVETLKPLIHFQNLDELERWLGNTGVIDIRFDVVDEKTGQYVKRFDCEDYAIRLQEKALRDKYIISFEIIRSREYNAPFKQKRIPNNGIHAIN